MSLTNITGLNVNFHVIVYSRDDRSDLEMIYSEFDIEVSGELTVAILLANVLVGMEIDVDSPYRVDLVTKRPSHPECDELTNKQVGNPEWWNNTWDEDLKMCVIYANISSAISSRL
ncbi:hypothetical protein GGH95_001648 [Coemansia sp. RSA 1836]|nr:hypothetical protein GGH95_001648 [Coemansia sp. RSA 1836]